MIYRSAHSDDYLVYLILREKQRNRNSSTIFLPIFKGQYNKCFAMQWKLWVKKIE